MTCLHVLGLASNDTPEHCPQWLHELAHAQLAVAVVTPTTWSRESYCARAVNTNHVCIFADRKFENFNRFTKKQLQQFRLYIALIEIRAVASYYIDELNVRILYIVTYAVIWLVSQRSPFFIETYKYFTETYRFFIETSWYSIFMLDTLVIVQHCMLIM